jgi:hypothetical protein
MRFLFTLLFLMAFSNFFWGQQACERLKNGIFEAKPKARSKTVFVRIVRNESKQLEILPDGDTLRYDLRWLSKCKYVLENNEGEEQIRMVVTITKIRRNYYDYRTTMLGQPTVTGRMYRKNENH